MDPTDRLAAANIVAAMITGGHPLVRTTGGMTTDWASIAKGWFDCAQALAKERQEREFKAGSR
jgi:hypothetical protein